MRIKKSYLFWRNCLVRSFMGLLSGLLLSACSSNKKDSATQENFSVTNPIVIDTIYTSEYVADIHSLQNVELRARVKGYIKKFMLTKDVP